MKDSDKILLDGLRSTVASDVPADHWEMVVKAVEDAGDIRLIDGYAATIVLGAIEKAKKKKKNKVQTVMGEFKEGKLESSSGKKVTNPKQAIAIALSEQRRAKKKVAKADEPVEESVEADDDMEKGRFASRSEAGRYAANMRWRGSVPQGGRAANEARMADNARRGKGSGNPARGGKSVPNEDARLRRVFMRWMDDDGPQTSAKDLQAMIDAKILKPEQLNNYDRALLGLPPQAKRMPLDSKQTGVEPAGNKEPFLDLTDIDPQGKLESKGEAQGTNSDSKRLSRIYMRWMDPDGPQTSASDLRAMIDAKILKPEQLNNYDRELLGLPPQAKRMPLESKGSTPRPSSNPRLRRAEDGKIIISGGSGDEIVVTDDEYDKLFGRTKG